MNGSRGATLRKENNSSVGARAGATTEGLFLEDPRGTRKETEARARGELRSPTPDDIWEEDEESAGKNRGKGYHENGPLVKRRKTQGSTESTESLFEDNEGGITRNDEPGPDHAKKKLKQSGPFIDESDSEDDLDAFREVDHISGITGNGEESLWNNTEGHEIQEQAPDIPSLVREDTNYIEDDEYANFDDLDEEGMQEESLGPLSPAGNECEEEPVCPICQTSLDGLCEMVSLPW